MIVHCLSFSWQIYIKFSSFLSSHFCFFLKIQNTHLTGKKVEVKSAKLNVFISTICHLQCSRECSRENIENLKLLSHKQVSMESHFKQVMSLILYYNRRKDTVWLQQNIFNKLENFVCQRSSCIKVSLTLWNKKEAGGSCLELFSHHILFFPHLNISESIWIRRCFKLFDQRMKVEVLQRWTS